MNTEPARKMIVSFVVAILLTGSFLAVVGFEETTVPTTDDSVAAKLENYTAASTGLPSSGDYFYLQFGDLNGDGYDDLVAGAGQYGGTKHTSGLHAYTSKKGSGWEKNSTGLPTNGYFAGLDLGDVDGDGDLDIVVGGEGWSGSNIRGVRVYVNNGTSGGKIDWDEVTGPVTTGYYDQCVFTDINDDDDLDIVAGTKGSGIKCWVGNGGSGGTFSWTAKNTGLPTGDEYTGVVVADMNKDGDLDIVATDYSGTAPEVRLYTGDGTGNWTSRASSFPSDRSASFGVDVGDVDKDGHMDIVYGSNAGLDCLLGNSGGAGGTSFSWTKANTNLATSGRHSELMLEDMDKDGDLDIVVAYVDGGVTLYQGNGGAGGSQSWTKASLKLPTSGRYYGAAIGDFNKDGIRDIGGCMWQDGGSAGGIYTWKGSVQAEYDPTAHAVWNDTTVNETTMWLGGAVRLDGTGSSDPQDAPAGDTNGDKLTYDWNYTVKPSTSTLTDASLSPSDSNAKPSFTPDKAGVYRLSLVVKDTAGNWSSPVYVKLEVNKPNDAPVADAGEDQSVHVGDKVLLNASRSSDPDGWLLAWSWVQLPSNPTTVTLVDDQLPEAYFMAPSTLGDYEFNLTVRDNNDTWSAPDTIVINVTLPPNVPPVAVAPGDFVARVNDVVRLNASASYDPDGEIVAWEWRCDSHPSIPMNDIDTEEARFTPVLPNTYEFAVMVQDDQGDWSAEDFVNVTVQPADINVPPVADIVGTASRNAYVGQDLTLNGSASHDDDGTIVEYLWNCTSHPSLTFTGQNTTEIAFRVTEEADYVFTLAVKDDNGSWSVQEDKVTIHVTLAPVNAPPVVYIDGPIEKVRPGDDVALDGSRSFDPDGTIEEFRWTCLSHPTLSFDGQNTSFINFTVPNIGDYTFTLTARDNLGDWSEEMANWTVSVNVNVRPVANITGPTRGTPGVNITFSAEHSVDEDGEVVAWRWNCSNYPDIYINGSQDESMFFAPPATNIYIITLVVQDDEGLWSEVAEHPVNITALDGPPVANAGADREVRVGAQVSLDGGQSYDEEGEIVAWTWRCTSNPSISGLVNADQEVASFTPPSPGTYVFSLEVQDEAGQWSEPDTVSVTVLEENSAPVLTVLEPSAGTVVLQGVKKDRLVVRWTATDANGDTLNFKVEITQGETLPLAIKSNLPHMTENVTFNDTNYNFPRDTDMYAHVTVWETNTGDRYEDTVTVGPFQIKEYLPPPPDDTDDQGEEGIDLNWLILGIVVLIGVIFAVFALSRGGDDDETPWEEEDRSSSRGRRIEAQKGALATKAGSDATAKVQAEKALKAREAEKTDPHGRLLDCPECGAPLDHDTDFGAPYCWDCDKYF